MALVAHKTVRLTWDPDQAPLVYDEVGPVGTPGYLYSAEAHIVITSFSNLDHLFEYPVFHLTAYPVGKDGGPDCEAEKIAIALRPSMGTLGAMLVERFREEARKMKADLDS